MGLLIECPNPKCRKLNGERALKKAKAQGAKPDTCTNCETPFFDKLKGRVFWIEYYDESGKLKRERIGSKKAAEQRHREVLSLRAEGRIIKKNPDVKTKFRDIALWYMDEIKGKKSFSRYETSMKRLLDYFGDKLLSEINPSDIESYRKMYLSQSNGRKVQPINPVNLISTNRDIALMKALYKRAIINERAEKNPCIGVSLEKEQGRDRVLSPDEYERLIAECAPHLKPVVMMAYHTGMRKGEILGLSWDKVDLEDGFVKLNHDETKTKEPRLIPLNQELVEMLKRIWMELGAIPLKKENTPVFTYQGRPIGLIRNGFEKACKRAGIEDFVFHDLRHTFNSNAFRAGVPIPVIMKITGHKSLSMFQRYTTISPEDLKGAVEKISNGNSG